MGLPVIRGVFVAVKFILSCGFCRRQLFFCASVHHLCDCGIIIAGSLHCYEIRPGFCEYWRCNADLASAYCVLLGWQCSSIDLDPTDSASPGFIIGKSDLHRLTHGVVRGIGGQCRRGFRYAELPVIRRYGQYYAIAIMIFHSGQFQGASRPRTCPRGNLKLHHSYDDCPGRYTVCSRQTKMHYAYIATFKLVRQHSKTCRNIVSCNCLLVSQQRKINT